MLYTETITQRELERIMRQIPNFRPRGHGIQILCEHEYNATDCDCSNCLYNTGKGRKIRCSTEKCMWLKERIKAGTASYKEILSETMSSIRNPLFIKRLKQYITESEECPMDYRNKKHRTAFNEAAEKMDHMNYALMAALYLLTADHRLWIAAKQYTERNMIHISSIKLRNCTVNAYTLLCVAKDLYFGTKHLTISDLADKELVSPNMFALICNAMAIRRFGLGAIKYKDRMTTV